MYKRSMKKKERKNDSIHPSTIHDRNFQGLKEGDYLRFF